MSNSVPDGWKSVKLDEVAEERSDRVDNPSKSGYDRFVGLEHLDSGELTVRRWGSTADLLSAMKLFKNGDILIGRRNAYLKRASKAEFDGVCSGDAYVVREKKGKIAEGLLPIILNSDSFWDYTIAHASGTMSKRAKWRDLAEFTFMLPSPEEQSRTATTLWAAEDCIVEGERFVEAAERAKQVLMRELFSQGIEHREFKVVKGFGKMPIDWDILTLEKIVSEEKPITYGIVQAGPNIENGIPYIRSSDLNEKIIPIEKLLKTSPEIATKFRRSEVHPGDIVFSLRGNIGETRIVPDNLPRANLTQGTARISCKPEFEIQFIIYSLHSDDVVRQIKSVIKGSTFTEITLADLRKLQIPIPPKEERIKIAAILTRCDETIAAARANVAAAKALKIKMINEMLRPNENA